MLSRAAENIEGLRTAPDVSETQLPKAWVNAWYKAGFTHGMRAALTALAGLAAERHLPKKAGAYREIARLLHEHRLDLMEQAIGGDRDIAGFVRYNAAAKAYEWRQPLSQAEGYEALKTLLEVLR